MKFKLPSFSIIIVCICLSLLGVLAIPKLNLRLTSSRTSKAIHIAFSWPNASSRLLEQKVTSRLEGVFGLIKGVKKITSSSDQDYGYVQVFFKENIDLDKARFEVANLIRRIYPSFPDEVSYPEITIGAHYGGNSPVLNYSINSKHNAFKIKTYLEEQVEPVLSEITGVKSIALRGVPSYEWQIKYDPENIWKLGVQVGDISKAINNHFQKSDLGKSIVYNDANEKTLLAVRLTPQQTKDLDWSSIPIKKNDNGRVIYLTEVAKIQYTEKIKQRYYRVNGQNTINLIVYPEEGVNTIKLSEKVRKKVLEIQQLNAGEYHFNMTYDASEYIAKELKKISNRSLFSFIILFLFSLITYRSWKYLTVLFCSIISSLLIAALCYYFIGVELQLYSLAGVTISFGIIIDNAIILIDHIRYKSDKRIMKALIAAALTTIAAVGIVLFLEESQRNNLLDFTAVMVINIVVSLIISYFFVPALLEKLKFEKQKKIQLKRKKRLNRWGRRYERLICWLQKPILRWSLILILLFGFGLPLHLIPNKIEKETEWAESYNDFFEQDLISETIRPALETIFGGTLKLFVDNVFENSYYEDPERTTLRIRATMPEGITVHQLNEVIERLELYLGVYPQIELFESNISSYRNSSINVFFKEIHELSSFPYQLKEELESYVIQLGSAEWSITGVGQGFSNAIRQRFRNNRIVLKGYNYDKLYEITENLGKEITIASDGRVRNTQIKGGVHQPDPLTEFYLEFDEEKMAIDNMSTPLIYDGIKSQIYASNLSPVNRKGQLEDVTLVSSKKETFSIWQLKNTPIAIGDQHVKLNKYVSITKQKSGNAVEKEDQQYTLVLEYDYVGSQLLSDNFLKEQLKIINEKLPLGFSAKKFSPDNLWNKKEETQYYLIFVAIGLIFFICAILLESLRQPIAIISMIPISFIGVFLTFYIFDLNFDQGGYAAFILLTGLSVNAALYLINDYNNFRKSNYLQNHLKSYIKAFIQKIAPIFLTIISTVFGLIPFVWGGQHEVFWFAFAAGTIGGLLFSLIGILIFLPSFVLKRNITNKKKPLKAIK